jgi:GT2 family glycosyltransferase
MFSEVEKDEGQYDTPCSSFWATGAALMVRTAVYQEVGGLDARFFAHMEEIDFCWRLHSRGYGVWCIPQSAVYHVGGGTLNKSNPQKTFLNFRNNLLMLYKNTPSGQLFKVMALRCLLDYVAALKMLLSGQFGEFLAVARARAEFGHIRHEFDAVRQEDLKKTTVKSIPEMKKQSLLVAFYLKHIRKFSDWK